MSFLATAKHHARRGPASAAVAFTGAILLIAVFLAISANTAEASFSVTDFKLTTSTTQAAGHPNAHLHVSSDAALADRTDGDDLKKLVIDFPAGLLGNPEAAISRCNPSQLSSDTCPAASAIGATSVKWREKSLLSTKTVSATGSVYVLDSTTAGSSFTVGLVLRPSGYRKSSITAEVTGLVASRSSTEADYGMAVTIDNIPRTMTTTGGSVKSVTFSYFAVDVNARANATKTGPYFTSNPTRCTAARTRAAITSYKGASSTKAVNFNPTGCGSVPFAATANVTATVSTPGASTGVTAAFTAPTGDATIQNSHVQKIQVDLPSGTHLDASAIGTVPALCSDSQLNSDTCPAESKIGTVAMTVPFVQPTIGGDVYLQRRGSTVDFGAILRAPNGEMTRLSASASEVDINSDGTNDLVRASATGLPQIPWSALTLDLPTSVVTNPGACVPDTSSARLTGWSGASTTSSNVWSNPVCDTTPPEVTITSPADGSTASIGTTVPVHFSASDDSGDPVTCDRVDGQPETIVDGSNTITVSCADLSGNSNSDSVTITGIDDTPPVISNVYCPVTSGTSGGSCRLNFTTTDDSGSVSCSPTSGTTIPLIFGTNTIVVTCSDPSGNTTSVSITATVMPPPLTVSIVSGPANGETIADDTPSFTYESNQAVWQAPYCPPGQVCITIVEQVIGFRCTVDSGAPFECPADLARGGTFTTQSLTNGPHTFCVNAYYRANGYPSPSACRSFSVLTTPPVPVITSPVTNSYTNQPSVTVLYTVPSPANCTPSSGSSVSLNEGPNVITVTCVDAAGNTGTASVVVFRDSIAPQITNLSCSSATATSCVIHYTVTDNVDPSPSCSPANGSTIPLTLGANVIAVSCSDRAGNSATVSLTIQIADTTPPTVTITNPRDGTITSASSLTLTYSVVDDMPGPVTCDKSNGSTVPLAIGANTITVTCVDSSGNSRTTTSTVTRISPPPPPMPTCTVSGSVLTCTWIMSAGSTATCILNGVSTSPCISPFVRTLVSGSNTFTLCITDITGNSTCSTNVFTVSSTGPTGGPTGPVIY